MLFIVLHQELIFRKKMLFSAIFRKKAIKTILKDGWARLFDIFWDLRCSSLFWTEDGFLGKKVILCNFRKKAIKTIQNYPASWLAEAIWLFLGLEMLFNVLNRERIFKEKKPFSAIFGKKRPKLSRKIAGRGYLTCSGAWNAVECSQPRTNL